MDHDEVMTLICPCGRRVRARGARPGRLGKCPVCGAMLQVPARPDHGNNAAPEHPDAAPEHPAADRRNSPGQTNIDPARSYPQDDDADRELETDAESRFRAPAMRVEPPATHPFRITRRDRPGNDGLGSACRYPLWDANGIWICVFFPPLLTATSLLSIGLIPFAVSGDEVRLLGTLLFLLPMSVAFLHVLGFGLQALALQFRSSLDGEIDHGPWPDWSPFLPLGTVLFGLAITLPGWVVTLAPGIVSYVRYGAEPATQILLGMGLACGGIYAVLAVRGWLWEETLAAASPPAVIGVAWRYFPKLIGPTLLIAVFVLSLFLGITGLFQLRSINPIVFLLWLGWTYTMYMAQVIVRWVGIRASRPN